MRSYKLKRPLSYQLIEVAQRFAQFQRGFPQFRVGMGKTVLHHEILKIRLDQVHHMQNLVLVKRIQSLFVHCLILSFAPSHVPCMLHGAAVALRKSEENCGIRRESNAA